MIESKQVLAKRMVWKRDLKGLSHRAEKEVNYALFAWRSIDWVELKKKEIVANSPKERGNDEQEKRRRRRRLNVL